MTDLKDTQMTIYDDRAARPGLYEEQWQFDPLRYLRENTDEEGRKELSLDIKYRKHWFRLVYPQGQIRIHDKQVTDKYAVFTVRVYSDRKDDPEDFLAEGTAIRYFGKDKAYERYYVDWAETMATGRALTSAGFDVPWCNVPISGGVQNPYTGEVINYDEIAVPQPADEKKPRKKYSDVTAPPDQAPAQQAAAPAAQTPAQQATAAPATQPPAQQVVAAPPAPAPAQQESASMGYEEALNTLSVEQAKAMVIPFGINKGKTLGQVAEENPGNIDWFVNKYKREDAIKAGAKILADAALQKAG